MGPIGRKKRELLEWLAEVREGPHQDRFWKYELPVLLLLPGYGLVAVDPMLSLGYLGALLIPIGIVGGILGEDRRAENVAAQASIGGTDYGHSETDGKMASTSHLTDFGANLGLLGFASFVLIAALFV